MHTQLIISGCFPLPTGGTDELAAIVEHVKKAYPNTNLIGLGFSMGANIFMKYLGEKPENQNQFICAFSACQGYDIER